MARILVVDDDPGTLELVKDLLSRQKHSVETAEGGAQALAKLHQAAYDLLIIDRNMPGMNGVEAIAKVRADVLLKSLKILLFTADHNPAVRAEGLKAGADDCLFKPIQIREFADTIGKALEKR